MLLRLINPDQMGRWFASCEMMAKAYDQERFNNGPLGISTAYCLDLFYVSRGFRVPCAISGQWTWHVDKGANATAHPCHPCL